MAATLAATKCTALNRIINETGLDFMMEAHSGLSARIAERAGFRAIWASGLSISASFGIRDRNEASWTQVLDVVEFMADSTSVPILIDGDTGHGDYNNVARFVRKLGQRGIAGVCIEDKLFPKENSFLGDQQALIGIDDFVAKIKAAKDSQLHSDFLVVARVEALIAGRSMEEALSRAGAYRDAGADAILIHSRKSTSDEIEEFCRAWDNNCPVVIVPTKYYNTPVKTFRDLGVSTVIWANHSMRASVSAMSQVCEEIFLRQSISDAEQRIASLAEVFSLTGEDRFDADTRKYVSKAS